VIGYFAALDVSQDLSAICIVDEQGVILAKVTFSTCHEAIAASFESRELALEKRAWRPERSLSGVDHPDPPHSLWRCLA
jgi:hypothetical protein